MTMNAKETSASERRADPGSLEELSSAIESGAGIPAVARAAARALDASVALIDRATNVLAVAAASPDEEKKLLADRGAVETVELRVADAPVGELRWRRRGESDPDPALLRMVATLLGLELERSRSPEWATDEAAGDFVRSLLNREVTDRGDIEARAGELGANLSGGAGVLIGRAVPHVAQTGEWRGGGPPGGLRPLLAAGPGARPPRAGGGGGGGEAEGVRVLAFDDTGAYRLLLPAMSEDPAELERFYSETVEPLVAYDEQYETELVHTVETYLENDGNIAATAQQLFTHRHTIRYRLERARELCGHDVTSTEGREKLGLGLKAMRVLGIASPAGPAHEPGTEAGRVAPPQSE